MASKPVLRDRRVLPLPLPLLLFLTALEVVLTFAPNVSFGHVDMTQCEAVFRKHCFAVRFGP